MSVEDDRLYAAEDLAFAGSPLGDQCDRRELISLTREIAADPRLVAFIGDVTVGESRSDMTRAGAYAKGSVIKFAPRRMSRFVAVHELAHVVHHRSGMGGSSHGPEYRASYVWLVGAVHGAQYADQLRETFVLSGLHVTDVSLPTIEGPPVNDIDQLAAATVRWI
jgi:hypothetical protein